MDITELDVSQFLEKEENVERDKKLAAACVEFMGSCGKDTLEVYRMEKFTPTKIDQEKHGKFHVGDSYVVCKKGDKDYDIHYWHGKECTSDEMGSSAFFTVQLSGVLTMQSNHHLEEQEYEGEMFLSYFKPSVEYVPGGIESGFRQVKEKTYEPRLLQCKGERYPRVYSVDMKADSINEGDVFILDMGLKIYFWPGDQCNVTEKMKALEVATNMRKAERHCAADILFPKEQDAVDQEFWKILGGKPAVITPYTPDDPDVPEEDHGYKFYKISNDTGKLLCTEVTERPLTREHLDTTNVFILELQKHVYIWIGKQADVEEKKNALVIGKSFVQKHNKPKGTRVTRIVENAEDVHFKSFFNGFYPILKVDHGEIGSLGVTANQDLSKVANQKHEATAKIMTQIGNTQYVKVYLCKASEDAPILIPETEHGHFFQNAVYLVDVKGDKMRYLIQWFGPRMAGDKVSEFRRFMAVLTEGMYIPREIMRVSMQQGHEDDTILKLFPNGFICHDGNHTEIANKQEKIKENGCMYKIMGPFGEQPHAVEQDVVECKKLNSNEAFVVVAKGGDAAFYWLGSGASEDEKAFAKTLGAVLAPSASVNTGFEEGSESDEFWAALGGKTEYPSAKELGFAPGFEPRLFHLTNSQGYYYMKEIYNYVQDDLNNNDIMALDAYKTIFIWVGIHANKHEKKNAISKVEKFIDALQDGRTLKSVQIVEIEPCSEPATFTCNFPEWEDEVADKWLQPDPYTALMQQIEADRAESQKKYAKEESKYLDPESKTFDIKVLQSSIPEGVPPAEKEKYLSKEQFEAAFNMDYEAFSALKLWKQKDLKKKAKLF